MRHWHEFHTLLRRSKVTTFGLAVNRGAPGTTGYREAV